MGALGEALGVPRVALGAPWGDLGAPGGGRAGLIRLLQTSQVKLLGCFTTLVPLGRPLTGTQMMRKADDFVFPGEIYVLSKSSVFLAKCKISYVVFMISSLSQ